MSSSKGYYHYWSTKWFYVGFDKFWDQHEGFHQIGRTLGHEFRVRISRSWELVFATRGKSYRELVGGPKELEDIDWVIDEFDSNFNALAVASLRYHQKWSVCASHDRYEGLIARLTEPQPKLTDTDDERATMQEWDWPTWQDTPPAIQALLDRYNLRESEYLAREDQARHDFVDIMRELWS